MKGTAIPLIFYCLRFSAQSSPNNMMYVWCQKFHNLLTFILRVDMSRSPMCKRYLQRAIFVISADLRYFAIRLPQCLGTSSLWNLANRRTLQCTVSSRLANKRD
jgi:hypothetical protein